MGLSFSSSNNRRNQNHRFHHHPSYYHHHPSYYHHPPLPPPPLPPPTPPPPHNYFYASSDPTPPPSAPPPNNYVYMSTGTSPYHTNTTSSSNQYNYQYPPPQQSNYYYPGYQNAFNYANPLMARPNLPSYYGGNVGWGQTPTGPPLLTAPPPPYVEHQNARVVKNDVNVHKDTIKFVVDENYPDHHLLSFVFDARFDGSITIYYFAKEEGESCKFTPLYPEAPGPVKVPFQNGLGQRFCQPSGTGVDLGFYDLEDLEKPSADDVFPLVIFAEVSSPVADDEEGATSSEVSPRLQVTQAVIERKNDGSFQVKVIRQILWIDGVRYEVRELYGIRNSSAEGFNDDDPGKECVICMTEPKDTAVMPCRHLCMCSDCAKELRLQSNKCPICRQPITELIEIRINDNGQ